MIDLHSHLLGEDESGGSLEGALSLCERARAEGIEEIVVTLRMPKEPKGELTRAKAYQCRLQELASRLNAPPKLGRGYEWPLSLDLPGRLRDFALAPTINESSYLLLSLPSLQAPDGYERVIPELVSNGYLPIIAHPECSRAVRRDTSVLAHLIKSGALIQVDALSVLGGYGLEVERFAQRLLERGQVHFIATRADQLARREASLSAACERAGRLIGRSAAQSLVRENPLAVLANTAVAETPWPTRRLPMLKAAFSSWG